MTEFVLGGIAAAGACLFTNPIDVMKTRIQLQGELTRGQKKHYRNMFHGFYVLVKEEGFLAMQKGLVPAMWYQVFMNGGRLGSYSTFMELGFTRNRDGEVVLGKSVIFGGLAGVVGAVIASPFFMVKTRLQSKIAQQTAGSTWAGHQHEIQGTWSALVTAYQVEGGILGLWRGVTGAIPRVMVGSAAQLATFSKSMEFVDSFHILPQGNLLSAFMASFFSGIAVIIFFTPFDVISTRLYNQGVNHMGRGMTYTGFLDCMLKIYRREGPTAFYKGWFPNFVRVGPHSVISLVLWNELRKKYIHSQNDGS